MKFLLFILLSWISPLLLANEIVIATTFSPETTEHIIKQWQNSFPNQEVRLINRTSNSLKRLLVQPDIEKVDLVLSSSPFLFQDLQEKGLLLELPKTYQNALVPSQLKSTTTAIAFSGYGILFNRNLLKQRHLAEPTDWNSLSDSAYFNSLLISSPSRSGSTHIMLEMLLQQKGWGSGWQEILTLSGNLSLISSRSFNVAEKIKLGLAIAGISIDSYANNLNSDPDFGFVYFPHSIASPAFISVYKNNQNPKQALEFIQFLLSAEGQEVVTSPNIAKFPLKPSAPSNQQYKQQQKLLTQTPIDYEILLLRQHLIEKLFDNAITFRLNQFKDVWALIYQQEQKTARKLTALRHQLTLVPVSEQQAIDPIYLEKIKNDRYFLLEQEKQWTDFFQQRINTVLAQLEDIK
ncbi:phosphonate ABC transporter substrate-binding protein [Rodentibacter caecimuris]|uniref:Phosphonate ABC transporter substrate-binding protein n=2 Tax=Rodentibacter caecimuris TaxID=1796644 RepID=A0AAJ3MZ85_9PAST|nr:ABC transporter substrate-binding protein [Rodentibacter heylii]AOF52711.1 Phosphoglycerate transport regulatory protein PgtC [Pasteurellaceae bacterium NI1060]OOF71956.1 phosphonate ABC transporter substrate-binding protein [Rodentibacter heylii]OOF74279.1 phosphonate ABC transporter substrate-binding protein [Rodentibacter heylii]OOF75065.1 phosphonate ABC transporter substrate-binding protein [Rodentibacter heylii]